MFSAMLAPLAGFQRSLIYFPGTEVPAPAAYGAAGVSVVRYPTESGLVLAGWHWPALAGRRTLVWFQGNAGHAGYRVPAVRAYRQAGYGVLLAGYRGFGGNPGSPSEQGLYEDGRAALDWLAGQGVPAPLVVAAGESLGTGVAVQMGAERPLGGLVLFSPYLSLTRLARDFYPWLPVDWLLLDRFDSLAKLPSVTAPLMIVHGARDGTVPVAHGRALLAAAPGPKAGLFLPEAGHNDLFTADVAAAVLRFLADLAPADGVARPAG